VNPARKMKSKPSPLFFNFSWPPYRQSHELTVHFAQGKMMTLYI
jgi:hypothetical protein